MARSAIFARRLVIMDEPTAALGVRESGEVLNLIRTIRDRGLPVILISHNMPHVFELADRITMLHMGRNLVTGTPSEIREDPAVHAAYLGTPHERNAA